MKKSIALVTLVVYLTQLFTCVVYHGAETKSAEILLPSSTEYDDNFSIAGVVLKNGETFTVPDHHRDEFHVVNDSLVLHYWKIGYHQHKKTETFAVNDILQLQVHRVNAAGTTFLNIGIGAAGTATGIGLLYLIILLTKESCPFIYSYNGSEYVFDAEPYGGSICEGLQRTDWCFLENMKEVEGQYRIHISNEVEETQYTDELKLVVADHPESLSVFFDNSGKIHTVSHLIPPSKATNRNGKDLLPFVMEDDFSFWQEIPSPHSEIREIPLREELVFEFPRPKDASQAKIVVDASTTLWGSQMIKKFLGLSGKKVHKFYERMKADHKRNKPGWIEQNEMYKLKVWVETKDGWKQKEMFYGGGPFRSERRLYELDISDVEGDVLKLKVNPPANFWKFNYIAVDYSKNTPVESQELEAIYAKTHDGMDLIDTYKHVDGKYHVLPAIGDMAEVNFQAPAPPKPGHKRTIMVKANGYYDIHLKTKSNRPNIALLRKFKKNPDTAIRYSIREYFAWEKELQKIAQKDL